jgi:hypothetical protein
MTAATAVPPELDAYLAAVRVELSDLDDAERDDLLAEVEASLTEAAADTSGPLETRFGAPAAFAAELRTAAGLQTVTTPSRKPRLATAVRAGVARIAASPRMSAAARTARELEPIWWVARAYFGVGAAAYVVDAGWSTRYPIVPRLGSASTGVVVIAAAVAFSVWLGLRARRSGPLLPRSSVVVNAVLLLAAIPTVSEVSNTTAYNALVASAYAPRPQALVADGLWYGGIRIDNVYPYSREGRLLHDVLLYDGAGRPIELRSDDPNRRTLQSVDGRLIFNAFPIRYFEAGTRRVDRPNAAPPLDVPKVATPPLRSGP